MMRHADFSGLLCEGHHSAIPRRAYKLQRKPVSKLEAAKGPQMDFRVETTFADDVVILHCYGNVSSSEALALSHAVAPLLFEHDTVVLDFSKVPAVDSGGLGTLTLLQLYVRSSGCRLRFRNLNSWVNHAIQRVRLGDVFDVHSTEEEAIPA
jgi:anti-anti-sigma factor